MTDLLVLAPIFHGSGTGAATYYRLLARELGARGVSVAVVSERLDPGVAVPEGVAYIGLLPARSSLPRQRVRALAAYAWQNATYAVLPGVVRAHAPRALLVHSSFHNFPGVFGLALRGVRRAFRGKMVMDVRDRLLPAAKVGGASAPYDLAIACSDNVRTHLEANGVRVPVMPIPVVQERLEPTPDEAGVPARLGVTKPFVFWAGMVKRLKAIDLVLAAFARLRRARPELELVVAGMMKTEDLEIAAGLRAEGVRYVGPLGRNEVLALMAAAELTVNLSRNEGMPRSSLEALALGGRVALPPEVPEFARFCPEHVVTAQDPAVVAAELERLLEAPPPRYPLERHAPVAVVDRYLKALAL